MILFHKILKENEKEDFIILKQIFKEIMLFYSFLNHYINNKGGRGGRVF